MARSASNTNVHIGVSPGPFPRMCREECLQNSCGSLVLGFGATIDYPVLRITFWKLVKEESIPSLWSTSKSITRATGDMIWHDGDREENHFPESLQISQERSPVLKAVIKAYSKPIFCILLKLNYSKDQLQTYIAGLKEIHLLLHAEEFTSVLAHFWPWQMVLPSPQKEEKSSSSFPQQ